MKLSLLRFNVLCSILVSLAFLALANCSGTDDTPDINGEVSQNWCVYPEIQQCFEGAFTECPGNGIIAFGCPYSSSSNGSGEVPNSVCVYPEIQQCFAGTECPGNGILAFACPYSSSGGAASSPSKGASSSSGGISSSGNVTSSPSTGGSSSSIGTNPPPPASTTGPVACYGKLKANGKWLVGSKTGANNHIQVRGVSLGWSNTGWESARFFDAATVNAMVDDWKAEIIRAPMGYSESGGYKTDASNKTRVETVVNAAIAKGVYVIIDWHSHSAHSETAAAKTFFTEMAQKYGGYDNVIFEVYNEPLDVPWETIKNYATEIISAIRTYSDNLILVGTPNWDQDINVVTSSTKINDPNIAYVLHFYAYSHPLSSFQSKVNSAMNAGVPVFVSEYGTTHADGGGSSGGNYSTHSAANTNSWMTYLDNNKISSCAWNVNDKYEGSAFFGTSQTGSFNKTSWTTTSSMTASGQYIYGKLTSYYANAPWRTCTFSSDPPGGGTPQICDYGPFDRYGGGCYVIYNESECDLEYGTIRASCPRKQYCDYGPVTSYGGGCFEIEDANDCDLEWGDLVNSCGASSSGNYCDGSCGYIYGYDGNTPIYVDDYCFKIGGTTNPCTASQCSTYGGDLVDLSWCQSRGRTISN